MTLLDAALAAHAAGLSVVPVAEDGSKRPDGPWKGYQAARADEATVRAWYANGRTGLGVVCGAVSGGLEMLELEGRAVDEGLDDAFIDACETAGLGEVINRITGGYLERTPSGGLHLLYRCDEIAGNLKLARRPATADELDVEPDDKVKVLLETRGEGGYAVTAPSCGSVHPTGGAWEMVAGGFDTIAAVTPDERRALLEVARSFDRMPPPATAPPAPAPNRETRRAAGGSVLDRFDDEHSNAEVLARNGFVHHHDNAAGSHWVRPGKDPRQGASATVWNDDGTVTFWSTSIDVPDEYIGHRRLRPCQTACALEHSGDFEAMARTLARTDRRADEAWMAGQVTTTPRPERPDPDSRLAALEDGLFRRYSASELAGQDLTLRWIARGLLVQPTYGQVAGELKTLKSMLSTILAVAVASGRPFLDRFPIDTPGPVAAYIGEGGRIPYTRRLRRIAAAMGVDVGDLPLHTTFDVAPIGTDRFRCSLDRDLDELRPVLFQLDPYYAYHGAVTDSRNLHQEGALLASISSTVGDAGASALIVNHFNQSGTGRGLQRITQAGSGEWVDSWLLVSHREDPDVPAGRFRLLLEVGSRQWGGTTWDVDLTIGALDPDTGHHDGDLTWTCEPHQQTAAAGSTEEIESAIYQVLSDEPWQHTQTGVIKLVGGRATDTTAVFKTLVHDDRILSGSVPREENGQTRRRRVYGLPHQPRPNGWKA